MRTTLILWHWHFCRVLSETERLVYKRTVTVVLWERTFIQQI